MDHAHVVLNGMNLAADGQRYSVAGSYSVVSFVEAYEPQSRGRKVVDCTYWDGTGGEIEVAKVVCSGI